MEVFKTGDVVRAVELHGKEMGVEINPEILDELKERGYSVVETPFGYWYSRKFLDDAKMLIREAARRNIGLILLTAFQKCNPDALMDHPDWRMRLNDGRHVWFVCPFNKEARRQHIESLKDLVNTITESYKDSNALVGLLLNDESSLDMGGLGCYCDSCKRQFREETGIRDEPLTTPNWKSETWRRWIEWRMNKWIKVHAEMKEALRRLNPRIICSIQMTPLWAEQSPWMSGVDYVAVADAMDFLSTDPYHTHGVHDFQPDITYMTENFRALKGANVLGKPLHIYLQGFFGRLQSIHCGRELTEKDGYWMAILPMAMGSTTTITCPLPYECMRPREKLVKAFERSFELDKYYRQIKPIKYAAVVYGLQTTLWHLNKEPAPTYTTNFFRPACNYLRETQVPYDHLWDERLTQEYVDGYKVLYLPRVSCLSESQVSAIRGFVKNGGGLVATHETSLYDEKGNPRKDLALEDVVKATVKEDGLLKRSLALKILEEHPVFGGLRPQTMVPFSYEAVKVEALAGGKVIATWVDLEQGDTGLPAAIVSETGGRTVYFTGEPTIYLARMLLREYDIAEEVERIIVRSVRWAAGTDPEVTVLDAPPLTELFVGLGESFYIATLASYQGDEGNIRFKVRLPEGKRVTVVHDLLSKDFYEVENKDGDAWFTVPLKTEEAVKPILIRFKKIAED